MVHKSRSPHICRGLRQPGTRSDVSFLRRLKFHRPLVHSHISKFFPKPQKADNRKFTTTMPALQDFLQTLLHEQGDCSSMSVTTDNAATHSSSVSRRVQPKTPPLSPSTQESRWGAVALPSPSPPSSRRTSYPCVVATKVMPCKGSRWNMSISSAPLNSSPLNRRRSYIVSPPQRRMSFDDGPRMVSMVAPARR